jgi:hypothetical protein
VPVNQPVHLGGRQGDAAFVQQRDEFGGGEHAAFGHQLA